MQIKFNLNNFVFYGVLATPWQRASGCDWPLPSAVGLSNNDVIALRPLRCVRCVGLRCFSYPSPSLHDVGSALPKLLWAAFRMNFVHYLMHCMVVHRVESP